MIRGVALDSGPLGRIAHPRPNPEIVAWIEELREFGINVVLPEIIDYELRRELLRIGSTRSIRRLDELKRVLIYLPLTTSVMLKAAELWADARKAGRPTADPKELDIDVILAAQALQAGAIVATENVGHLSLFVEAKPWQEISPRQP